MILDYGHNSSALLALNEAIEKMPHRRRKIVYTAAGDRRDGDIIRQAKIIGITGVSAATGGNSNFGVNLTGGADVVSGGAGGLQAVADPGAHTLPLGIRAGTAQGDQFAVPAKRRRWRDNPTPPQLPRKQTRRRRQHEPVLRLLDRARRHDARDGAGVGTEQRDE